MGQKSVQAGGFGTFVACRYTSDEALPGSLLCERVLGHVHPVLGIFLLYPAPPVCWSLLSECVGTCSSHFRDLSALPSTSRVLVVACVAGRDGSLLQLWLLCL